MNPRLAVIVAAGGSGERFGRPGGKQTASVLGRPLLWWTMQAIGSSSVDEIVVVCAPERIDEYRRVALDVLPKSNKMVTVAGGETRQESVARGLEAVSDSVAYVAVHDGARPLVTAAVLSSALERLERSGADGMVVGHPCFDTLKRVEGARVTGTPDRSEFWIAQTPQVFRRASLISAYQHASASGFTGTDDASVVEYWGGSVEMIEGPRDNIKVTTREDVRFVEAALRDRQELSGS
jgi:2-C-methyl-D-erythritol 4-phosphate cytidylyltransferase